MARRSFNGEVRRWKLRWAPWDPFETNSLAPRPKESVQLVDGRRTCCGASAVTGIRTEREGRGVEAVGFHCVDLNAKVKVSASLSRESFDWLLAASEASSGHLKLTEMFGKKNITGCVRASRFTQISLCSVKVNLKRQIIELKIQSFWVGLFPQACILVFGEAECLLYQLFHCHVCRPEIDLLV